MRKLVIVTVITVGIILVLFFTLQNGENSSDIIRKVVVYEPLTSIGSLYNENASFEEIDRTHPEGVLFCKTRSETTNQLTHLYAESANKSEIMELIQSDENSFEFKKRISQKRLVFSFYYYGIYGPPHWFGIYENQEGTARSAFFLEQENGAWRQGVDSGKYPIRIAFFDSGKKYGIFDAGKKLIRQEIDTFINAFRNIDDVITEGMAKDPEYYGPVQILK